MLKWISILVLSVALLAAAGAGVFVWQKRDAVARAQSRIAESREQAAKDAARQSLNEERAAAAAAARAASEAKTAEENRLAKEAELEAAREATEKARLDGETARENRAAREAEADAADAARETEKAKAEAAKAEAEKAKAEADAEAARAEAEAAKLERERLAAEAVIAEEKLWQLKALDLATLERELNEFKRELDERELALRPEKTIKDLVNIGTEEPPTDGEEAAPLAENDPTLPGPTRRLARVQRLVGEASAEREARSRAFTTAKLERLYVEALRTGRITAADHYRRTLKSLYPGWEYRPPKNEE